MEISAGARIDRYLLVEPLGEGGQGSVWKAMDALDASRVVALKLVPIAQAKPNHLERVRREARALAKLEHASLVRCHGLFEDFSASVLGLVLELVDGKSLAGALDDGRFTRPLRWAVLEHVARALAHLHDRHIVHRDLKPENIVLAARFWTDPADPSTVKIVDFGIAAEEGNPNPLTAYGNVIGTPAYMAPELIDATYFASGGPTPAVDVFAFGVVAWILLLGGHPTGLSAESTLVDYAMEYRKVVTGERSWGLTGAPPFVAQCLEPRPERRLQSGAEIVRAIEGAPLLPATETIGGRKGTVEEAPAPELFRSRLPRTKNLAHPDAVRLVERPRKGRSTALAVTVVVGFTVGAAAVAVALAGLGWWILSDGKPGDAARTSTEPRQAAVEPGQGEQPATAGQGLEPSSEKTFRFDGVAMSPGSPTESFPDRGESLRVQVIRTGASCSVFPAKSCRLPVIVQDLTASGQGVSLQFYRDGALIGSAGPVRLSDRRLFASAKGYWVPIRNFVATSGAPFGPTGAPKALSGFLEDPK